jgi:[acyl-carrier-protein] S-malonyltransferase
MNGIAFLYAGQGAQTGGMLDAALAEAPRARELLASADAQLGIPLSRLMRVGPTEALLDTTVAQPALVTLGVLQALHLRQRGFEPQLLIGHSVGQFAALVTAGALEFDAALDLVRHRARFMAEAMPPEGGAMAAILGADRAVIATACREAAPVGVVGIACHNAPGQTVIAGTRDAVDAVGDRLDDAGFGVAVLAVSVAAHSALMQPAADRLAPFVAACTVRDPRIPVIDNVTARPIIDAAAVRRSILEQLTAPVLFEQSASFARAQGVDAFVECGPGDTLVRCVRRQCPEVSCFTFREALAGTAAAQ